MTIVKNKNYHNDMLLSRQGYCLCNLVFINLYISKKFINFILCFNIHYNSWLLRMLNKEIWIAWHVSQRSRNLAKELELPIFEKVIESN